MSAAHPLPTNRTRSTGSTAIPRPGRYAWPVDRADHIMIIRHDRSTGSHLVAAGGMSSRVRWLTSRVRWLGGPLGRRFSSCTVGVRSRTGRLHRWLTVFSGAPSPAARSEPEVTSEDRGEF